MTAIIYDISHERKRENMMMVKSAHASSLADHIKV